MKTSIILLPAAAMLLVSCDRIEAEMKIDASESATTLQEVAQMLSSLPLEHEHFMEAHTAVCSSVSNGYDEEYTMYDLFRSPGSGVGDDSSGTKSGVALQRPMKVLIEEYLEKKYATKAGSDGTGAVERYINSLIESEVQIYWPFSEGWDGKETPVITFDPCSEAGTNIAYSMDGREVTVSESYAREHPVWVVNVNDDSAYMSYEMLLRLNPEWGQGGSAHIGTQAVADDDVKSLRLNGFKMNRNYDSWFAGASEFFVKCGSVENFKAASEADLLLYTATVTDFMIVVKRRYLDEWVPYNVPLVSDWTGQLEDAAFMIVEDDGGSRTSWKVDAVCKVNSKSYGITVDLPFRTRDDIVWRGHLSRRYLESNSGAVQHFGDVDVIMTLE